MTTTVAPTAAHQATPTRALTVPELDRGGVPSYQVYTAGFYGSGRDFTIRSLLGRAVRAGSDAGEVLATVGRIAPDDHSGWITAWAELGGRLVSVARTAAERGHLVSASRAYLRAATYYAVAVNAVSGADDADRLLPMFRSHRAAWEGFVATTSWPVERVDIPYEGTSLPGFLFHPDTSTQPRPTLVLNNGSDGSLSGGWCGCTEGALERGYRVLMFDGPGQQSMLFERGIPFRHDWEAVLTPVVDFLLERTDVDAERLAVYGISQAGYWVPRALAFEHRFAAAIIDGGVVDLSRTWFAQLPPELLALYERGDADQFDQAMAHAMSRDGGAARQVWQFRARPYGVTGYSDVLDAVSRYKLNGVAEQITTPAYIIDPDGEQFFPGQSAELAASMTAVTLARFTEAEGASYHCQPMARELTEQRMFDWLDEELDQPNPMRTSTRLGPGGDQP